MPVTAWNFNHPEKIVLQELLLVKADLHRAKQCIQLCLGPPYLASHAGLFAMAVNTQALISYMRCFGGGKRKGLKREIYTSKPELLEIHDKMKKLRDQHIAHSAGPHEHLNLVVAAESPHSAAVGIGVYTFFLAADNPKSLREFLRLVNFAERYVSAEVTRIGNAMAKDLIGSRATWKKALQSFYEQINSEQLYSPRKTVPPEGVTDRSIADEH
jgi:hypothetical protein